MKTDSEKYERIIEALRNSAPELTRYDSFEEAVISGITEKKDKDLSVLSDFLFGWIYISWVRKSLIAASFALLGFFIWQQHSIISQIDDLSSRIMENDRMVVYNPSASIEKRQMLLKYSREKAEGYYITEEDLMKMLDSLNQLNIRYRDLRDLIDDDPELRKIVREKLERKLGSRIKL